MVFYDIHQERTLLADFFVIRSHIYSNGRCVFLQKTRPFFSCLYGRFAAKLNQGFCKRETASDTAFSGHGFTFYDASTSLQNVHSISVCSLKSKFKRPKHDAFYHSILHGHNNRKLHRNAASQSQMFLHPNLTQQPGFSEEAFTVFVESVLVIASVLNAQKVKLNVKYAYYTVSNLLMHHLAPSSLKIPPCSSSDEKDKKLLIEAC